ncbi:MAG: hypothetical protein KKC75_07085 [Nanoarchaeota archaeon]|nr:hypothetical protein [Nanoarchaeota archaeon]MBU1005452.1 hypothetical protein [Nanoarchaeota archaeon]MBU1947022.1 hypothetical protein [Nanoarchaeota archaeon]
MRKSDKKQLYMAVASIAAIVIITILFFQLPSLRLRTVGKSIEAPEENEEEPYGELPFYILPVNITNGTEESKQFIDLTIYTLYPGQTSKMSARGNSMGNLFLLLAWIADNLGFSGDFELALAYNATMDLYDEYGNKTGEKDVLEEVYCSETNIITEEHLSLGFDQYLVGKKLGVLFIIVSSKSWPLLGEIPVVEEVRLSVLPLDEYASLCPEEEMPYEDEIYYEEEMPPAGEPPEGMFYEEEMPYEDEIYYEEEMPPAGEPPEGEPPGEPPEGVPELSMIDLNNDGVDDRPIFDLNSDGIDTMDMLNSISHWGEELNGVKVDAIAIFTLLEYLGE